MWPECRSWGSNKLNKRLTYIETKSEKFYLLLPTVQAKSLRKSLFHLFLKCINFYNVELIIFIPEYIAPELIKFCV